MERRTHQNEHVGQYKFCRTWDRSTGTRGEKDCIQERHKEWNEGPFCVCCRHQDEGNIDNRRHEGRLGLVFDGRGVQKVRSNFCYG